MTGEQNTVKVYANRQFVSMTTKDKPGTLPQYAYGIKKTTARPVPFVQVTDDGDNTPVDFLVNEDDVDDTNVVLSNTLMVVAERESCLFLSKDSAKDDTGIPCTCIVLQQDSVLPTTFIAVSESEVVNPANVKATLVQWEFINGQDHQDGITISEDMLLGVLSIKDNGDSLLCTELDDIIEEELIEDMSQIDMVKTRSGRTVKRKRDDSFYY